MIMRIIQSNTPIQSHQAIHSQSNGLSICIPYKANTTQVPNQ